MTAICKISNTLLHKSPNNSRLLEKKLDEISKDSSHENCKSTSLFSYKDELLLYMTELETDNYYQYIEKFNYRENFYDSANWFSKDFLLKLYYGFWLPEDGYLPMTKFRISDYKNFHNYLATKWEDAKVKFLAAYDGSKNEIMKDSQTDPKEIKDPKGEYPLPKRFIGAIYNLVKEDLITPFKGVSAKDLDLHVWIREKDIIDPVAEELNINLMNYCLTSKGMEYVQSLIDNTITRNKTPSTSVSANKETSPQVSHSIIIKNE